MHLQFVFAHLADFTLTVQALDALAARERARARDQALPADERELSATLAQHASRVAREIEERAAPI